jgi:hypothetical protein
MKQVCGKSRKELCGKEYNKSDYQSKYPPQSLLSHENIQISFIETSIHVHKRNETYWTWSLWVKTRERKSVKLGFRLKSLSLGSKGKEESEISYIITGFRWQMCGEPVVWFCCRSKENPLMSRWTRGWGGSEIITQRGVDVGGFSGAHALQWSASVSGEISRTDPLWHRDENNLLSLSEALYYSHSLLFALMIKWIFSSNLRQLILTVLETVFLTMYL